MRRAVALSLSLVWIVVGACGGGSQSGQSPVDPDASTGPGDGTPEGGAPGDEGGVGPDGGPIPTDSGRPPWDGKFTGPLTCSGSGAFMMNYSGACGVERWAIKTGADSAAAGINLLPQLTTVAALGALTPPASIPFSTRVKPTETTVFALKDVTLSFVRLEDDGDYHLVLNDGPNMMISEIPYPGGTCTSGTAWQCLISKARAAVDAHFTLALLKGKVANLVVSVAGVAFFDTEHSQFGAAPNAVELHPLLAICFGKGCSPQP